MTIAQEADAVASSRQSKEEQGVSRKGMTSGIICNLELDYQTLELPGESATTCSLLLYNLHTTTLICHTLTYYQYHDPFYYYFKDPLWNQDAKENEDQFFFSKKESKSISFPKLSILPSSNLSTGKQVF
jgi:hypothetical protein